MIHSFVSEHIETLEEIDVEYKELAMKSGVQKWGRVPALGCEPTFISDLADAVIESLPYVGAMAVSNLEARQVPLFFEMIWYAVHSQTLLSGIDANTINFNMLYIISYKNGLRLLSNIYVIVSCRYVSSKIYSI